MSCLAHRGSYLALPCELSRSPWDGMWLMLGSICLGLAAIWLILGATWLTLGRTSLFFGKLLVYFWRRASDILGPVGSVPSVESAAAGPRALSQGPRARAFGQARAAEPWPVNFVEEG